MRPLFAATTHQSCMPGWPLLDLGRLSGLSNDSFSRETIVGLVTSPSMISISLYHFMPISCLCTRTVVRIDKCLDIFISNSGYVLRDLSKS